MKKLLVYGLDGATFTVLNAYARANPGGLFSRLLAEGHTRVLTSTMPYFTAPAWSTFMTGLSPGHHGMYHWRGRFNRERGERPLISSRHVNEATFWSYCQQNGGRVSVSNYPMQYPAPPTDGRYICGTLAPEDAPSTTWPPELVKLLRADRPDYRFEMNKGLSYLDRPQELYEHIMEIGRGHVGAMEKFGAAESVDLFVHVVTITDRMQHFFWHCFDERHPGFAGAPRPVEGNQLFDAYALAEQALARLWGQGRWDNLMVVSDHGMGPSTVSFHADAWLASRGYAVFGADGRVDVPASLAYSGEEPECSIYVNRQGRDGAGAEDGRYPELVEQLRRELLELTLPDSGRPAFKRAYTQAELYEGPAAGLGPDLVLVPEDGVHPRPGRAEKVFDNATRLYAGHRPEGIFIGHGSDFKRSPLEEARTSFGIDAMFPLMCALMGLPVPSGLAAPIPEELLGGLSEPPEYDDALDWRQQVEGEPEYQESAPDILARLAELGYI